jgi:hypothetical protein
VNPRHWFDSHDITSDNEENGDHCMTPMPNRHQRQLHESAIRLTLPISELDKVCVREQDMEEENEQGSNTS